MTAHANRLTSRAIQTFPVGDVRVFASALERLGFDCDATLAAAGLRRADLEEGDRQVPCDTIGTLLAHAARQRPTPNLGLQIGSVTPIGAYPLLDYVIVTCDTVGSALTQLARYLRLASAPAELTLHDEADPIRAVYVGPPMPFAFEYSIALCVSHLREETAGRFEPLEVAFAHRLDDVDDAARRLGCAIVHEAGWNGWTMMREALAIPMRRRDPILRGVLEGHADETVRRLPPANDSVQSVRRTVVSRMTTGGIAIGEVARELGRSARSLQRELVANGTTYQAIVDHCRRSAAERYLGDRTLPIAEIAYLLGYSEPAAFHRAFKRWRGETPLAFRQRVTAS